MSRLDAEVEARLVEAAWAVRVHAYAPYSRFKVGAAVLAESGQIYSGANVENASFPAGCCAERSAVAAAASAGERRLIGLAVATDTDKPVTLCGLCRQTVREFARDLPVILSFAGGRGRAETTLAILLPNSFGPEDLLAAAKTPPEESR